MRGGCVRPPGVGTLVALYPGMDILLASAALLIVLAYAARDCHRSMRAFRALCTEQRRITALERNRISWLYPLD